MEYVMWIILYVLLPAIFINGVGFYAFNKHVDKMVKQHDEVNTSFEVRYE